MFGFVLFLLFTVVPALEIWLLIQAGQVFGGWQTVAWLVSMGLLGTWLGQRAGFAVLREIPAAIQRGESPSDRLVEAALVVAAGVLLITPGILTDVVGMALFVGPIRRWLAPRVRTLATRWLMRRGVQVGAPAPGPAVRDRSRVEGRFKHPTA